MFTYVKLKNFMSFGEVTFDFKKKAGEAKPLVAIYGENGSGKSNFVRSIDFLCHLISSYDESINFDKLVEQLKNDKSIHSDNLIKMLKEYDFSELMSSCRMLECQEPTEVEYGYILNGWEGYYKVVFDKNISYEKLYGLCGLQRGTIYEISRENKKINSKFNSKLFANSGIKKDLDADIEKFWGKHSFLSILAHHINEKNNDYMKQNLSSCVFDIMNLFNRTSVMTRKNMRKNTGLLSPFPKISNYDLMSGTIRKKDAYLLDKVECILNDFFTQTYADIKKVTFERKQIKNGATRYQLYVDKIICGKIRHISFENESSGTQQILNIIRILLGVFCGVTVVYDEIDNGIHDLILNNIIASLSDYITGQLIITTHNTMLMETINPNNSYVISVDYNGNKEIKCLSNFSIQSTNNIRNLYIKGVFGGVPYTESIDYDFITETINEEDV